MQGRQSHFDITYRSSFLHPTYTPSKPPPSKLAYFGNTLASLNTDMDQPREEDCKAEQQIPETILSIVGKRQNERTSTQNSTIFKYLSKKNFFRFLADKLSIEGVKTLIKSGNLKVYQDGEIFICGGRRVKTVDILLFGEAYIISHLEKEKQGQEVEEEVEVQEEAAAEVGARLEQLIQKVGREARRFRLRWQKAKGDLQKSHITHKQNLNIGEDINLQACQKIRGQAFIDLQPLFDYQPKHSRTVAAKQQISVFSIPVQAFYECLLQSYNLQLNQKLKVFRKVPIFDAFQNSKLKTLIQRLSVRQLRKGECVYRQGDQPTCFYLLMGGQVEISKTIDLFSQNPNNLYKNRVQVSRQRNNRHIKVLPYANFNRVYNYAPEQKVISLAQVNPVCIFGEEEVLEGKRRQVTARVTTLTAQLYDISLQAVEELCGKMIGANGEKKMTLAGFLLMMEESLTLKKILFRQNHLSQLVSYQNRSKYNTLFEGSPDSRTRSHKHPRPSLHLPDSLGDDEAPPQFNNFNFTDFLKQENEEEEPVTGQLNEEEARVARLTHVKFSEAQQLKYKEKSIRLRTRSKEFPRRKATLQSFATSDSVTNKITLQEPLFTVNYFERQLRQQKKLYAQAKKKRLDNIYRNSPERATIQ